MAYTDNFPQRPVFMADFANGGKIDPRATFSRSDTPPTYAAASAVHFWSNEKHLSSDNLLLQSSDFVTSWSGGGLSDRNTGQADPVGGTNATELVESGTADFHRVYQSVSATGDLALTVYAKRSSGSRYLNLAIMSSAAGPNGAGLATFDLSGGATHTSNGSSSTLTGLSATQTASGNGYYKCVFKATASAAAGTVYVSFSDSATPVANNYGMVYYTGDGTSSIDVAFASLSTTGATDYNATTTQIHREYAPTLKSVATAGAARFEYDPTDGQSEGILIESQFQQDLTYTEDLTNAHWTKANTTIQSNAGVAPDGTLTADLIVESDDSGTAIHRCYNHNRGTPASGVQYTFSAFVKAAGRNHIELAFAQYLGISGDIVFNLTDGSTSGQTGNVSASSATNCGNGWWRVSVTTAATTNANALTCYFNMHNGSTYAYEGNGFGSVLVWGANQTQSSHSYSYLKADGAATTKAADSLSVATADIPGFSEGVGTVVYETGGVASGTATNQLAFGLRADSANFFTAGVNNGGVTDASVRVYSKTSDGDQAFLNPGTATVGTGYKLACRYELDNIAASMNGGTVVSDTSGKVPVGVDTLWVGELDGNYHLNSNVKRIAVYNEALSDTNLQALTS